jgi:hypothetical protein
LVTVPKLGENYFQLLLNFVEVFLFLLLVLRVGDIPEVPAEKQN